MPSSFNKTHRTVKKNKDGGHSTDLFQTPFYALPMLARHLPDDAILWEPACGEGQIVRFLKYLGCECFGTDYQDGEEYNFFTYEPEEEWDILVTNPPWSLKIEWTERCLYLGKPFALLVPITYLESAGTRLVHLSGMEIIMPYQRIAFKTPHEGQWACYDCKYIAPNKYEECPECGGTDKIRKVVSSPQKKSMWITWGLNLGTPIEYVDIRQDMIDYGYNNLG